jgi:hypothetical protein
MFSILHITDLHRVKSDPLTNSELLSALIGDRDRYVQEDPPIRAPDAIVVSGDVVQGVTLDHPNYAAEIAKQYDAAHDFLAQLTERFLGGDRTKVVIVPGNHDIDWNVAYGSMEVVEEGADFPKNLPAALHERDSPYRWDWKSRRLYQIKDENAYANRLAAFWKFFEKFYGDFDGLLKVAPWADANLYSLDEGRICVAAFNSCAGNDCFAFHGEISRAAVGQAHLDLMDLGPWRLQIAVWHHDVEGPPHRTDYMDLDIVRGMIGRGFRLGLYGHQHRAQITPQQARMYDQETMAIASAGSLCAGRKELPTGALRGYSIVEIADDYRAARIHVREMSVANLFSRATLRDFAGASFVDMPWSAPVDAAGRPVDFVASEHVAIVRRAEDALKLDADPATAVELLSGVDLERDAFARKLAVEAAVALGDPKTLIKLVGTPSSQGELVYVVNAYAKAGETEKAEMHLRHHGRRLGVTQSLQDDMIRQIKLTKWNSQ